MPPPIVVCADIGSVAKGNFGWWSSACESGSLPSTLAAHLAAMLDDGAPVALGFECPLFVPISQDELQLTKARPGEGSRPWSAGAGCGALATGLVEVAWVLEATRNVMRKPVPSSFLDWQQFDCAGAGLFIWEAFVSGSAKQLSHVEDAMVGACAFLAALPNPELSNAIVCESKVHSLIGAAMLGTGWSADIDILRRACPHTEVPSAMHGLSAMRVSTSAPGGKGPEVVVCPD